MHTPAFLFLVLLSLHMVLVMLVVGIELHLCFIRSNDLSCWGYYHGSYRTNSSQSVVACGKQAHGFHPAEDKILYVTQWNFLLLSLWNLPCRVMYDDIPSHLFATILVYARWEWYLFFSSFIQIRKKWVHEAIQSSACNRPVLASSCLYI